MLGNSLKTHKQHYRRNQKKGTRAAFRFLVTKAETQSCVPKGDYTREGDGRNNETPEGGMSKLISNTIPSRMQKLGGLPKRGELTKRLQPGTEGQVFLRAWGKTHCPSGLISFPLLPEQLTEELKTKARP